MEELVKQTTRKIITEIDASLQKGSYNHSNTLPNQIIDFSLIIDSEMGVFIGEVLEGAIIQFTSLFREYVIPNNEKILQEISPLLNEINNSISSDEDQNIYRALSKLRLYVTKQQKIFPVLYKQRDGRGQFF